MTRISKATPQPRRSHCKRGHEFTPANTMIHVGDGHRRCRACQDGAVRKPRPYDTRSRAMTVACPDCGSQREVQERQARRIQTGEHTGRCMECRYPAATSGPRGWMTVEERETPAQTFKRLTVSQKKALAWLGPIDAEEAIAA